MSHKSAVEQAIEGLRNAYFSLDIVATDGSGRLARVARSARNKAADALHQLEKAVEALEEKE